MRHESTGLAQVLRCGHRWARGRGREARGRCTTSGTRQWLHRAPPGPSPKPKAPSLEPARVSPRAPARSTSAGASISATPTIQRRTSASAGRAARSRSRASFSRAAGIAQPNFDDADWRAVDLPHDWAVELPFVNDRELDRPRLQAARPRLSRDQHRLVPPHLRRSPPPTPAAASRSSSTASSATPSSSLNGHYVGRNLSGYAPFRVRRHATSSTTAAANVLVVRVDATEHEGWFYEGAGIYRHVWLGEDRAGARRALGHVRARRRWRRARRRCTSQTDVANDGDAAVDVPRRRRPSSMPAGASVATARSTPLAIAAWSQTTVHQQRQRPAQPHALVARDAESLHARHDRRGGGGVGRSLRDAVRHPHACASTPTTASSSTASASSSRARATTRTTPASASALPDRLQEYPHRDGSRRWACNAYRTSHNPPTPELLDACDRLGMLVLDETRMMASTDGGTEPARAADPARPQPSVRVLPGRSATRSRDQGTERGARIADDDEAAGAASSIRRGRSPRR